MTVFHAVVLLNERRCAVCVLRLEWNGSSLKQANLGRREKRHLGITS